MKRNIFISITFILLMFAVFLGCSISDSPKDEALDETLLETNNPDEKSPLIRSNTWYKIYNVGYRKYLSTKKGPPEWNGEKGPVVLSNDNTGDDNAFGFYPVGNGYYMIYCKHPKGGFLTTQSEIWLWRRNVVWYNKKYTIYGREGGRLWRIEKGRTPETYRFRNKKTGRCFMQGYWDNIVRCNRGEINPYIDWYIFPIY